MIKAARFFALFLLINIATVAQAHAYLDPGTGSIMLQAIIGGVAAALFVGRSYLYRFKMWLGLAPKAADLNKRPDDE